MSYQLFRKYNKWMLIVGMTVLMLAFMIQGTLSVMVPDASDEVIGTVRGEKLRLADQREAAIDLDILQRISPMLPDTRDQGDSALRWLLMLEEAKQMGLSAGQYEVATAMQLLGLDEQHGRQLAINLGTTPRRVEQAIKHWAMVQTYKELVAGLSHRPHSERIEFYQVAGQFMMYGYYPGVAMALQSAEGRPRLSTPLLQRFIYDQQARITTAMLPIGSARYLEKVPQADPALVAELFEKHKDQLPGEGEPYGFGYRTPDRVKLEYLAIPINRLRDKVQVEEADALSYYDQHPAEFTVTAPATEQNKNPQPQLQSYDQVRDRILIQLRDQAARELGQQMIKSARAQLIENARPLATEDGYRVVPVEGWQATPLRVLAEQLQQRFGVLPDVHRVEDRWLDRSSLAGLPGVGSSFVEGRPDVDFATYMLTVKELKPAPENPLRTLRLQAKLPSSVLAGLDGSLYLARVIEAEPARSPESLDEVRQQVEYNARQVQAYGLLKNDQAMWLDRARTQGLDELAPELGASVIRPQPFSQRELGMRGVPEVPVIDGVGQDPAFVDHLFDNVQERVGAGAISDLPPSQRILATPVDRKMSLMLVRVDDYQMITRKQYEQMVASPQLPLYVSQAMLSELEEDPLSFEAISKRVGYQPARTEEEAQPTTATAG